MRTWLLTVALFVMFCSLDALAAGRLEGRIASSSSSAFLEGASVSIPALGLETVSRSDGRFVLPQVPAGNHEVIVTYSGFPPDRARVSVSNGTTTVHQVDFTRPVEEIVVYGDQSDSAAASLTQQKNADSIKSVVSATEVGQFPDSNVAEALQRVPGVFLERDQGEGRFVGIRGSDPNLVVTTINGVNVPAPENNRRSVALDVIPAELLATLEVNKTLTPDMDGDGIGGAVNIKSASGLDVPDMRVSLLTYGTYNELEEASSPKLALNYADNFDAGTGGVFGVAAAVSWFERDFGSENVETDGGWPADLEFGDSEFKGAEEIEQRNYVIRRERLGAVLNFDYLQEGAGQWYVRTLYSEFSDQEFRTRNEFKFDDGEVLVGSDTQALWQDATLEKNLKDRYEEQEIFSVTVGGTSWFGDDWTVDYAYGYSKSDEEEPGRKDTEFEIEGVQLGYRGLGATPTLV